MTNILFICKYNRFRSRVSEAYMKNINKNKNIKIASAGLHQGSYPLDENELAVSSEMGIDIDGHPRKLNEEIANWANTIIISADDVLPSFIEKFTKNNQNIIHWAIPDDNSGDRENIERIINIIKKKVDDFNKFLK